MKKTQSNWLSRVEVIQAMIALFRDNTEVTLDDVLDAINSMEDEILWTAVDDYPPETGDLVLVSMGDEVGLGMYVGDVSCTEWWDDCQNEVEVDAWAELPIPWRGEE